MVVIVGVAMIVIAPVIVAALGNGIDTVGVIDAVNAAWSPPPASMSCESPN